MCAFPSAFAGTSFAGVTIRFVAVACDLHASAGSRELGRSYFRRGNQAFSRLAASVMSAVAPANEKRT